MKFNKLDRLERNMFINHWLVPELEETVTAENGNMWINIETNEFPEGSYRYKKMPKKIKIDTKQYNILKRVWEAGQEGLSFTDIQMFILGGEDQLQAGTSTLPHERQRVWDYDNSNFTDRTVRVRQSRGHYGTWITNTLPCFCTKGEDGRWRLTQKNLLNHFNFRFK